MKFRHFFLLGAALVSAAGIVGCSKSETTETAGVVDGPEVVVFTVDSIVAAPDAFVGDTVVVEGVCNHICKHGGKKAFLLNADSTQMLMCIADESLEGGAFAPDCPGKVLTVTGVMTEMQAGKAQLEAIVAAQAQQAEEGHCDSEERANGSYAEKLEALNAQIAANPADSLITIGYYINATGYSVAE